MRIFNIKKTPTHRVFTIFGIIIKRKLRAPKVTPIEELISKIDLLDQTIKADLNLIFKYISRGVEIHPAYGCERVIIDDYHEVINCPAIFPNYYYEHIVRYQFAANNIKKGDVVLDLACGSGYGSKLVKLETEAHSVIGADIAKYIIEFNSRRNIYPGLDFVQADGTRKEHFKCAQFDKIISFETIEHVSDIMADEMFANFYYWLKADGALICSTPNEKTAPYIINGKITNQYHFKHYTEEEMVFKLTRCGFREIAIFYQDAEHVGDCESVDSHYLILVAKK
jgi:2-polyprenyl-3-methyl-5-hydroxy-6-metoxy-1,4-benzoquinol methylase